MNFSIPLGFAIGIAVVLWSIFTEMEDPTIFGNLHGIVIVFGGTLAAALVCFKVSHLLNMIKVFFRQLGGSQFKQTQDIIKEIAELAEINHNTESIESELPNVRNHFLRECLELIVEGSLNEDEFVEVLEMRLEAQEEKYSSEEQTFKAISKFPPAFGLIGATMGMIGLLQGLGSPDAFEKLGPTMSVALTATFWGLTLANLFLIPIGENLHLASQYDLSQRRMIVEGVKLMREKKHPIIVREYLKSHLSPKERNRLQKQFGS